MPLEFRIVEKALSTALVCTLEEFVAVYCVVLFQ